MNTITFDSINPDDEGLYECYAYNEAGGSKRLINIEVRGDHIKSIEMLIQVCERVLQSNLFLPLSSM